MKVTEKPALGRLNTFGVAGSAALLIEVETEEDVLALPSFNQGSDIVLGGGSNVLLVSDIPGSVFLNRISGIDVLEETDDAVEVEAGAGENWDQFVDWSLDRGLSGLENLSLIPGCVGAAPMQNIGAYGVELSSVLKSVTAWDWRKLEWRVFGREECQFGYRDSLFKTKEPGRYLITSVRLVLRRDFTPRLQYAGLAEALAPYDGKNLTPRTVSDAVKRIRRQKLPDPARVGNAGSFFKNPVVPEDIARALQRENPGLPSWPVDERTSKLAAGWLIERCGLKGCREGGAMVSEQHALVLINSGGATGQEVWSLARRVRAEVERNFGIRLEPEPQIVNFG